MPRRRQILGASELKAARELEERYVGNVLVFLLAKNICEKCEILG